MKFGICMTLIVLICSPALAVEECRSIQAKADREACYQRQESELATKRKARAPVTTQAQDIDEFKREDDRLARQLRTICRGC